MTDSFFSARNQFDLQIRGFDVTHCELLINAASRRMVMLNGPLGAAPRIQRVADIVAGAYVLPIDHWRTSAPVIEETKTAPVKAKSFFRTWAELNLIYSPHANLIAGFIAGWFWGIYTR